MNTKIVSQLNEQGYFTYATIARKTPLEQNVWHIPINAVDIEPPEIPEGMRAFWNGTEFILEEIPPPPEPEELPIEHYRGVLWDLVKQIRTHYEYGGVFVNGSWFHTDVESRLKHTNLDSDAKELIANGALPGDQLTIAGFPIYWTTMSNTNVVLTNQMAMDIALQTKLLDMQIYPKSQTLRAQINASTTKEQLEAIDIYSGWVNTFAALTPIPYW